MRIRFEALKVLGKALEARAISGTAAERTAFLPALFIGLLEALKLLLINGRENAAAGGVQRC
jgi:hypothetical protein